MMDKRLIEVKHRDTGLVGRVVKIEASDSGLFVHIDSKHIQIKGVYRIESYLAYFDAIGVEENGKIHSAPRRTREPYTPDWRALYV